jgi:ABC-type multidrug transport system fused ATPase/permease subunit
MNNKNSLVNLLKRIRQFISIRRQKQLVIVALMMVVSSLLDVFSLGILLPFLAVLIVPDRLLHNHIAIPFLHLFNITTSSELILPLTIIFITSAILSGAFRTVFNWVSNRAISLFMGDISIQVYRNMLYQPYKDHLTRNSGDMINVITQKLGIIMGMLLQPLLAFFNSLILICLMLIFLMMVNFGLALSTFLSFGVCYVIITRVSRKKIKTNGKLMNEESNKLIRTIQEALGGIRDIVLDNSQQIYCNSYSEADIRLRRAQSSYAFLSQSPRFLMETLIMLLIATIAIVLSHKDGGLNKYVPILGILAIGAQRMLPALQQLYLAWSSMVAAQPALNDIVHILEQPLPHIISPANIIPLQFSRSIELVDIDFSYNRNDKLILNKLNLVIPKGSRIGFVGSTGSGKSTTLDIIMGLLPIDNGKILIDNQELDHNNIKQWQANIAHVPQNIFLADSTFANNIAFGVKSEHIDMQRVKLVAKQAQIDEFIEMRPNQYNDMIGEGGIRLSGGQRQRIGIARALYKQANVLVFDEATSALDNATEQAVMNAINSLDQDFTILIIAHRLNTVRNCNVIVELENGTIKSQGTYEELLEKSDSFRSVIKQLMS